MNLYKCFGRTEDMEEYVVASSMSEAERLWGEAYPDFIIASIEYIQTGVLIEGAENEIPS